MSNGGQHARYDMMLPLMAPCDGHELSRAVRPQVTNAAGYWGTGRK
jgi:hypothetical protein